MDMFERLKSVADSFLSKAGDKFADYVVDTGQSLVEFNRKLQNLKANSTKLSCKASDLEMEIKNKEVSGRKKRKREVEKWLEMVQDIERDFRTLENEIQQKGFIKRLMRGDRVAKLNSRVESLIEQSQHFNGLVLDAPEITRGEPLLSSKLSGQTFVKNLGKIRDCLLVEEVPIIGIYGVGGVGKTTLAMHIHDLVLEETDNRVYWVRVSQEDISINKLQEDIAKAIGLTFRHESNEREKRAAELNRALRQRAGFVLILDDVCKDIDLERMGYPVGEDGCRLIMTSRLSEVCRRIGCKKTFEVERIGVDEAWRLFKEKFGQDDEATFAPGVEEIARTMVRNCGGVPGGIIDLARGMRGVTELSEWRNALEEIGEFLLSGGD